MARNYGSTQIEFNGLLYISAEILSQRTGYSVHTLRSYARSGRLPTIRCGHRWMFNEAQVLAVLSPNMVTDASDTTAKRSSLLARL